MRRTSDEVRRFFTLASLPKHSRALIAKARNLRHSLRMEAAKSFFADVEAAPQWVQVWLNFMSLVFVLAIPVAFRRLEGRLAILLMLVAAPSMIALHSMVGYSKLLGIVHVVLWTPFVIWLWRRRGTWRARETLSGKWIALLFATMIVSLAFDYSDVVRWLLGERG